MKEKTKIFLSAVSTQFKDCRDALASDLRAIGCEVQVQEDFQQGPRTLIERLEEYVARCDRVIALVGDAYGSEASGDAVPLVDPPRSYTQWEYFFTVGERLASSPVSTKDHYVYFASDAYLAAHAVQQPAEHAERQRRFAEHVKASGKHWSSFGSLENLCRLVLRDGWQMTERPPRPTDLPHGSMGALFKGRGQDLENLHQRLWRAGATGSAVAIHGLGGVGKTRLAIEYALRHQNEYSALLYVSANTREAFNANLAGLCSPLVLNLPEREAKEEDSRVAAVLRWLDEHPGWLLILDNVDTPEGAEAVEERRGQLVGGHLVITSRLREWSGGVGRLELGLLSEDDAVAFLLDRTEGRRQAAGTDEAQARALAVQLDRLALALEQASAFISTYGGSFADYLQRWRAGEKKVHEWHDARLMQYPRPLAVTWHTTVSQLDPSAVALLRLLSWLAPEPIPRALLETEAARQALTVGERRLGSRSLAWIRRWTRFRRSAPADLENALAALANCSLIQRDTRGTAFRMHRLVQEMTRDRLPARQQQDWLRDTLGVLDVYLPTDLPPQDVRSWPRWEPVRAHVGAVVESAAAAGIDRPTTRLMDDLGRLLQTKCLWAEAESLYRRELQIVEARYGPDHPQVASAVNNLGTLLQATNHPSEAEALMRRVVRILELGPGGERPDLAAALSNLASLLQATNRREEAEPLMRRALSIDEACHGPNHPDVATDLNNLALLLQATNRRKEAEPLMQHALLIDEARYGPNHPEVATDLNNLGALLQDANRPREAEPLIRRALAINQECYGPDHPEVATGLNNLASLLKAANRLAEAEPLMRRALEIDEARYGPDHPRVARDLNNLGLLLQATNRPGEAEPLMRRALRIDEASNGPDHPNVARDLSNLARLLKGTNRLAEAEALMRRALGIDEASYGPDHPEVATDLNNLALLLKATDRLAGAETMMRRALEIDEASCAADHPILARDLGSLAELLQATNRLEEAEPLMRRALEIDEAGYGSDHPEVAEDFNRLALLLQATNRLGEAEPLMRRALGILVHFRRLNGHEHPDLKPVAGNYRALLEAMDRTDGDVEKELETVLGQGV
jgi:tetratricopeptide (TPR) repeat protein